MNTKPHFLALGGSIRAFNPRRREQVLDLVSQAGDLTDYISKVDAVLETSVGQGRRSPLSNTEILCGASLVGAAQLGASVDYFPLARLFPRRERPLYQMEAESLGLHDEALMHDNLDIDALMRDELVGKIHRSDGVIISSPVYFGDRSSVTNKVLQFAHQESLFAGKLVSAISCGAKRNGGQETGGSKKW